MGVIEAIKKGFSVAAKNMGLVLVLIIFNVIWNLASIPLAGQGAAIAPGTTPPPQMTAMALLFTILFILASIFVQGGTLGLVKDYLKEGKASLPSFAKYGLKYYLRLLGLGLIIVLIIAILGLVAAIIIAATAPLKNFAVTIAATVVAVIIGVMGLCFIFLLVMSPYALVCDELGIGGAIKKSIAVVKKAVWKVLLLLILLILISLGIGFIIGFAIGLATAAAPANVGQWLIGIVNSIFNGYLGVVMMAAFMALYLSLIVKEKAA
jgi:hypothetical protein